MGGEPSLEVGEDTEVGLGGGRAAAAAAIDGAGEPHPPGDQCFEVAWGRGRKAGCETGGMEEGRKEQWQ